MYIVITLLIIIYILSVRIGGRNMSKRIIGFLISDKFIISTVIVTIFLFSWFWISYNRPINIDYKYNGIKYQAGNLQSEEPINIEIKGKYLRQLFVDNVEFYGVIKVGDKAFDYNPVIFNRYGMGQFDPYGMMFISDKFEILTIEILEPDQNGGRSWSPQDGWLISAPCNNRVKAVEISNTLEKRLFKNLVIK
mgnify:CR=1 FL=1